MTSTSISAIRVRHTTGHIGISVRATGPNVMVNGNNSRMRGLHGRLGGLANGQMRVGVIRVGGPSLSTGLINRDVTRRLRGHITFHHTVGRTVRHAVHTNTRNVGIRITNHLGNTSVSHIRHFSRNAIPLRALHTSVSCT